MTIGTLSTKGQLIIPVHIRRQFHLKPKGKVDIHVDKRGIVLYPIPEDPIQACFGVLKTKKSVTSIMHGVREEEKRIEKRKWGKKR